MSFDHEGRPVGGGGSSGGGSGGSSEGSPDGYGPPPVYGTTPGYGPPPVYGTTPAYGPPPVYGQPQPGQQQAYGQQQPPRVPPAGETWAPPPKPGLIPLRPLAFGTLLGAPFRVLRRNPAATFGSALIIQFAILLVAGLVIGGAVALAFARISSATGDDRNPIEAGSVTIVALSALVPVLVGLVLSALLQGILVLEVSREILGEKRKLGELWRAARKRLVPLSLWILLQGAVVAGVLALSVGIVALLVSLGDTGVAIGVAVGIILALGLVVLYAWVSTKVSLVACAIVLEGLGVRAGIRRSWTLTNRSFWKTLGTQWLVALIVNVASQIISQPIGILFGILVGIVAPNGFGNDGAPDAATVGLLVATYLVTFVIQLVFGAITLVVQAATTSLIYVDLRMRKEGLDIELIRFVEAAEAGLATPADDPFRAPANVAAGGAGDPRGAGSGFGPVVGAQGAAVPGEAVPGDAVPGTGYPGSRYPGAPR